MNPNLAIALLVLALPLYGGGAACTYSHCWAGGGVVTEDAGAIVWVDVYTNGTVEVEPTVWGLPI